jgi:diaminohydroxyphosphoribosylaminopyrimidine deaminase/5-amino-6-(5-phosphoribosylamino)uracil reductase
MKLNPLEAMKLAISEAKKGLPSVSPNPAVGCVILDKNNQFLTKGYHQKAGEPHAEIEALKNLEGSLEGAQIFVTLEPCSHYGKTPPCVDLIIRYKIKYVVIGKMDPNPMVCGKGIHKLMSAGCDIKVGVLEQDCQELNKRFYTFYQQKRPYIILK